MARRLSRNRWDLEYDIGRGGIILRNVKHDNFNLAREIRVTRIWICDDDPAASFSLNYVSFELNSPEMPMRDAREIEASGVELNSPSAAFSSYHNVFGLDASYATSADYLAGTPNACRPLVSQRYLFGNYGRNPPHEPGAVLDATRLFPLLSFEFPPVALGSRGLPYPRYLRADFLIDVDLDNIDEAGIRSQRSGGRGSSDFANKAAIFRDKENLAGMSVVVQSPAAAVQELFAALEKPLQYEIVSWGIARAEAARQTTGRLLLRNTVSEQQTWDNVHIWPARRGGPYDLDNRVSTPGAFHALHCHWRWGAVAGRRDLDWMDRRLLPAAGQPQFRGLGWSPSAGGALVDPGIPRQNLKFAVTKSDIAADQARTSYESMRDFENAFYLARLNPEDVSGGSDLVFWLSFEVFRDPSKLDEPFKGTLFVNGFYFAHNQDDTPFTAAAGGAYGEASNPHPTRQWTRFARS